MSQQQLENFPVPDGGVIASPNDSRLYKLITLENKLDVLLISDKGRVISLSLSPTPTPTTTTTIIIIIIIIIIIKNNNDDDDDDDINY